MGWPGSVHDARVFANSDLYKKAIEGSILNEHSVQISHWTIPTFLIGDSAYPLLPWLIKPFAHNASLTSAQSNFNYRLSSAHIVVENAFGRLKARWRRLQKQNDMAVLNVPHIIQTCCILHNMCKINGDSCAESWLDNLRQNNLQQPVLSGGSSMMPSGRAKQIRETLVQYYNESV